MIVICPSCNTQYVLADGAIGARGRRVKCTTCGHTWLEKLTAEPPIAAKATLDQIAPPLDDSYTIRHIITPIQPEASMASAVFKGILVAFVIVLITLGVIVGARQNIVKLWTPSALIYDQIGFPVPVPGNGLQFQAVKAELVPSDHPAKLVVSGKIVNTSHQENPIPPLLIRATNNKAALKDWQAVTKGKILPAGDKIDFHYTLTPVPTGISDVSIRFSEQ